MTDEQTSYPHLVLLPGLETKLREEREIVTDRGMLDKSGFYRLSTGTVVRVEFEFEDGGCAVRVTMPTCADAGEEARLTGVCPAVASGAAVCPRGVT